MSSIKDKLTQSVRQARDAQPVKTVRSSPSAHRVAGKVAEKPATAPQAAASKPAVRRTPAPVTVTGRVGAEPTATGSTLFPQRIWPD
jgi:hypothetical protein